MANQPRQGLKYLNRFMVLMYRLGLPPLLGAQPPITGSKTSLRRRTPVNFAIVDGELYWAAGFGAVSNWYKNVMPNS
jgi:hypothetical protein